MLLPEFDPVTGLLPPGRYTADLDTLHDRLVSAPGFTASATRAPIWAEWELHRAAVEAEAGEITRLWLGGSFVSGKLDPADVDVTYLLRAAAFDRLQRDELRSLDDLTDRTWCVERGMRVDAYLLRLPEDLSFGDLAPRRLTDATDRSFRDLGLYDEIWQRCRPAAQASAPRPSRRGYVEVLV
ncbi:DUF6932 family protein [Nocardiopsis trehalosi]|uniref:DUF6932 family protein n=1 Tax=Nocardiopsis trehalosi TaxID=109329 RepID=UPI000831F8F3|nr:hypothetical protein [Nocardiopsis trehalosi]